MKKRTWLLFMGVSVSLCLVLAYVAVRSWKEYKMACANLEQLEKITTELKALEEKRIKELESYLADTIMPILDGDVFPDLNGRLMFPYTPLPRLYNMPEPR